MATSYDNLYIINYTDINSGTISIPKGAIITDRIDVALIGKNTEYGELLDENVLHLLENFASLEDPDYPNAPVPDIAHGQVLSPLLEQPTDGQFWFNKTRNQLFVRNNSNQPLNNFGVWKALKFRNDIAANSGMIAHGQQIPVPVNTDGYTFTYDECSWIVSPVAFDSKVNYAECYTDSVGTVFVRYRATNSSELTPGLANYVIIGVKGSANHGVPFPTPTPSILPSNTPTPTPVPSNTPTISPTPGVSSTPTPTVTASLTLTPSVTPTLTRTPTVTPSPSTVAGNVWTQRLSTSVGYFEIEYGGFLYVALGWDGSQIVTTVSGNGLSWDAPHIAPNMPYGLNGIKYADGLFWALGYGYIGVSTDGFTWTPRTLGYCGNLYSIAHNGSRYVNVGYNPCLNITYVTWSNDGFSWNPVTEVAGGSIPGEWFNDIAYGNGTFVAVGTGYTGGPIVSVSPPGYGEGEHWYRYYTPIATQYSMLERIAYGNGLFVAVGWESDGTYSQGRMLVVTSPDGFTWTQQTLPSNPFGSPNDTFLNGIVFNSVTGLFFAVGGAGRIFSSPDGIVWTEKTSGTSAYLLDIATTNTQYVTLGYTTYPNSVILSSP